MSAPLAYLITWTTYGTWLPGDARGWVEADSPGIQEGHAAKRRQAQHRMQEPPVILNEQQRRIVESTIRLHCEIRRWTLQAINVRSNHVHLVVTADVQPEQVMGQLKAWCSRRLGEASRDRTRDRHRQRSWTEHGSTKWINDEGYLLNAIRYVLEGQ